MKAKVKNLFLSRTFLGAAGSFLWFLYELSEPYFTREKIVFGAGEIRALVGAIAWGAYTIYGRYSANAIVFTPPALPGRNREDAVRIAKGE